MSRGFNKREKTLLLILVLLLVALVYIVLIHQNVREIGTEAKSRIEAAEYSYEIESAKAQQKSEMAKELSIVKEDKASHALPDYDNAINVMAYLHGVMAPTSEYNLVFNDVSFVDYVAVRSIDMDFTCYGYKTVDNIVKQLEEGPYYCEVTSFSIVGEKGNEDILKGNVTVQLTVVFYEYAG